MKVITSEPYGEILGLPHLGEDASELIAEMGPRSVEATAEDVISTIHAHLTMAGRCTRPFSPPKAAIHA